MKLKQEKLKAYFDRNKGQDCLKVVETTFFNFKNVDELSSHIYSLLFNIDNKEGYIRKNLNLISKHIAKIIMLEGRNFGDGFNWVLSNE